MDVCKDCIAFKIHHNQTEPLDCPNCNKKTFFWKQDSSGTFYLECTNCGSISAVDLNTPCEQDPLFSQKKKIVVEPLSKEPSNRMVLVFAKRFLVNGLQMREKLVQGFFFESDISKIEEYADLFEYYGIAYRIINPEDPRLKYHYYEKCKYPFSAMKIYLN